MSTRKGRKESLEWKLPVPEKFTLSDGQFDSIVEALPRGLYITVARKRELRDQIVEAREKAANWTLLRSESKAALLDRLKNIQFNAARLINSLAERSRQKTTEGLGIIGLQAKSSNTRSRRTLNHKIHDVLVEIAAPELGHDDYRIQRLQRLRSEAPTYRHLQSILDNLVALEKWTKMAVRQCQQPDKSRLSWSPKRERDQFLKSTREIWLSLKPNSSAARRTNTKWTEQEYEWFAITVAKQFGWNLSAKVVRDVIVD